MNTFEIKNIKQKMVLIETRNFSPEKISDIEKLVYSDGVYTLYVDEYEEYVKPTLARSLAS